MLLLQHLLRRAPAAAACTVLTASYTQARAQQAPLQCDDGLEEDDDDKFEGPRRHTLADPNRYD